MNIKVNGSSLYCAVLFAYIFVAIWNQSVVDVSLLYNIVRLFAIAILLLLYILDHKLKKWEFIILIVVGGCCFASVLMSEKESLIMLAAFILCARHVEFDQIVRSALIANILAVGIIVFLSLLGIIADYTFYHFGVVAHSLGFGYYSTVAFHYLYIVCMEIYLKKKKMKWMEIVILLLINYVIYRLSTLRLAVYLTVVVILWHILFVKILNVDLRKRWIRRLSIIAFPIGVMVSYWSAYAYNSTNATWRAVNSFFTNRLKWGHIALQRYSLTLFGQTVKMFGHTVNEVEGRYFYIDSGFLYSLIAYGLIFTIIFIILYSIIINYASKNNDKEMFIWATIILLFSMVNNTWLSLSYTPLLLIVVSISKEKNSLQWARRFYGKHIKR